MDDWCLSQKEQKSTFGNAQEMPKKEYIRKMRRIVVKFLWIAMCLIWLQILIYTNENTGVSIGASVYATSNEEMIHEQQEEFGIQDFLKNSKEYAGEFFADWDLNEVLSDAVKGEIDNASIGKKILSLLGTEVVTALKAIGSILVIIVIHSILKAISESLENDGISKLIYYAQYILIITIILANFSDIVKMVQDTTTNLVAFMNMLVPLLITLMMSTGSIATSGVLEPIILFMINFIRKYHTKYNSSCSDGFYSFSDFIQAF